MDDLKDYPFCGRGARMVLEPGENLSKEPVVHIFVRCRMCGARSNTFDALQKDENGIDDAMIDATDAWNGRWGGVNGRT